MIEHLAHGDIDKAAWDERLLLCENRMWYAQSWVLDVACPGWEALLDTGRNAMMPLTERKRFGIHYLYQPFALQQLGPFVLVLDGAIEKEFLDAVPQKFAFWDIWMSEGLGIPAGINDRVVEHTNYLLDLQHGSDDLRAGYSQGHRRNLRKVLPSDAERSSNISAKEFVQLYARTTGARFGKLSNNDAQLLERLITEGTHRDQCSVTGIRSKGDLVAAIVFMKWEGRLILLKSACDERGQELRAMFRLIDDAILNNAGNGLLLDFAGSNTASVARFNAGFGAQPRVYLRLVRNLLPPPLRWFKQ